MANGGRAVATNVPGRAREFTDRIIFISMQIKYFDTKNARHFAQFVHSPRGERRFYRASPINDAANQRPIKFRHAHLPDRYAAIL
jgi:hypothetical protein